MKPIILTAGDDKFRDLISISLSQIKRMGYRAKIYDLGGLGIGQEYHKETTPTLRDSSVPWYEMIRSTRKSSKRPWLLNRKAASPWKPELIQTAVDSLGYWEHMMWLDGDAIITESIDEVFRRRDYDVAITLRNQKGKQAFSKYLNAGVLIFRNTPGARQFLNSWVEEHRRTPEKCDQHILHSLLREEQIEIQIGRDEFIDFLGARVLLLPGAIYNHTIGSSSRIDMAWDRGSKIWHLKASYYPHQAELKQQFIREVEEKCQSFHEKVSST